MFDDEDFSIGKLVLLAGLGVGAYFYGPTLVEEIKKLVGQPGPAEPPEPPLPVSAVSIGVVSRE